LDRADRLVVMAITLLRQYLARIDDDRLKRAFAAAIDVSQPKASTASTPSRRLNGLWKGVPSRSEQRS